MEFKELWGPYKSAKINGVMGPLEVEGIHIVLGITPRDFWKKKLSRAD